MGSVSSVILPVVSVRLLQAPVLHARELRFYTKTNVCTTARVDFTLILPPFLIPVSPVLRTVIAVPLRTVRNVRQDFC